jgi:tRNA threonylcarbamoyl adenosine modification protein YeaZ
MILALDSSTEFGSAALLEAGHLVREVSFPGGRSKGGGAAAAIEELATGDQPIDLVVVGIGPGSYNGIRSAVAAAWGFAQTRRAKLTGVSSLLALAAFEYLAVGDARQGHYYFAHVSEGRFLTIPCLLDASALIARTRQFPHLPVHVPTPLEILPEAIPATPSATLLASFASSHPATMNIPEPIYLKPPHITQPRPHVRAIADK